MMLDQFQFDLPEELIATVPSEKREDARLLVYDRVKGKVEHSEVKKITQWLKPTDLMIFNQTRVRSARIEWKKATGGEGELLLLKCIENHRSASTWEALVSGRRLKPNIPYELEGGVIMKILGRVEGSRSRIELSKPQREIDLWMEVFGKPPLPPYIRAARRRKGMEEDLSLDKERYQTAFASKPGAIAAPTAGLHFSEELLGEIQSKGVGLEWVTLDVGWGTFQSITEDNFKQGRLHEEWVEIPSQTAEKLKRQLKNKNRIIAVGTTTVRALEWWNRQGMPSEETSGWCDLFLYPPWRSEVVSSMVTNFHLPGSSLLALVSAFLGSEGVEKALSLYQTAIEQKYRFYSYGDAMLIL